MVAMFPVIILLAVKLPVTLAVVDEVMLVNAPELGVVAPIAPTNEPLNVLAATFLVAVMFPATVNKLVILLNVKLPVATNTPDPSVICIWLLAPADAPVPAVKNAAVASPLPGTCVVNAVAFTCLVGSLKSMLVNRANVFDVSGCA